MASLSLDTDIHPMPLLTRGNTPLTRRPVQISSEKKTPRLMDLQEAEEIQNRQTLEEWRTDLEQWHTLLKTFESVKCEFSDLDGLSWSTPEAQRRLLYWLKSQVLTMRCEVDCLSSAPRSMPATPLQSPEASSTGGTIRAPSGPRFPPSRMEHIPPLALPSNLQEHVDAVLDGDLPGSPSAVKKPPRSSPRSARRMPPHRVFSFPLRAGPPPEIRTKTIRLSDTSAEPTPRLPSLAFSSPTTMLRVSSLPASVPAGLAHIASTQLPSDGSPPTLSTPRVGTARPDSERGCPIMERTRTVYGLPARQARKEVAVPTSRTPSLLGVFRQQIDAGSEPEPPKMERTRSVCGSSRKVSSGAAIPLSLVPSMRRTLSRGSECPLITRTLTASSKLMTRAPSIGADYLTRRAKHGGVSPRLGWQ